MTDICSVWSYQEIKDSGYLGKRQAMYLSIFIKEDRRPFTHKEASDQVCLKFGIRVPERNGRIAELEEMGFIEKYDHVRCMITKKLVNRWRWTGRYEPLEKRERSCECDKCGGTGYIMKAFYVNTDAQMKMEGV